ncbi:uncharacterized protein STEHIDRAFT_42338, partial [Stereum hirsutum FP-91666 SS1]|uniref:uncharacterized protein n=1 Tax=Stereum hirsutum (strain FP-91666) TaxID=721885 RepID=UPI000440DC58
CLARNHNLSSHTPLCTSCGLILCALQPPYFPCPHCSSPLLTPSQQLSHLSSLALQLSETLEREENQRLQAIENAKKAAGAFPVLGATI